MYKFGRFVCWVVCGCFVRLKVSGRQNIPKRGGFILASNHLSYLDPVVLGIACPRDLNFMAKEELFRTPFFGWVLRNVGAFPVKRKSADTSALKEAIKRVSSGKGLVLFPEGGRGNGAELDPAEAGIGFIAAKAAAPVIPALIKGTEQILSKQSKKIKSADIRILFGKQISVGQNMPYQDAADLIMENIRHLSG